MRTAHDSDVSVQDSDDSVQVRKKDRKGMRNEHWHDGRRPSKTHRSPTLLVHRLNAVKPAIMQELDMPSSTMGTINYKTKISETSGSVQL